MSTRERLQTSVMPEELEAILDATNRIAASDTYTSELERQAAAIRNEAQEARCRCVFAGLPATHPAHRGREMLR